MLCQRNCNRFNKIYYYRPQTKLQKGNVFTSVCQEFCPPGWTRQTPTRQTPLGRHPPGRHTPRQTHPSQQTATAVDGTHPTGMHSCHYQPSHADYVITVSHRWSVHSLIRQGDSSLTHCQADCQFTPWIQQGDSSLITHMVSHRWSDHLDSAGWLISHISHSVTPIVRPSYWFASVSHLSSLTRCHSTRVDRFVFLSFNSRCWRSHQFLATPERHRRRTGNRKHVEPSQTPGNIQSLGTISPFCYQSCDLYEIQKIKEVLIYNWWTRIMWYLLHTV